MTSRVHGEADALCRVARLFGERRWCLATSGNFSARVDKSYCLVTESGVEKSRLTPEDLMLCDLDGAALDADRRPSAETTVHAQLYRLDDSINAVLHTHSVAATVVSRRSGDSLTISGFEMQKAPVAGQLAVVPSPSDTAGERQHVLGVVEHGY